MAYPYPEFAWTPAGLIVPIDVLHSLSADPRTWDVTIKPPGTSLSVPIPQSRLKVGIYRILIEAGMAFTRGVGTHSPAASDLAPVYRYLDLFRGTAPRLHIASSFAKVDSRLKQLLAEEVAIGITCFVLRSHMDIRHIADVEPLIGTSVDYRSGAPTGKRPDYYCLDSNDEVVFAESKGVVGPPSRLSTQMTKGWKQVQSVVSTTKSTRSTCGRAVIGTSIRVSTPRLRSDTLTEIRDPEGPTKPMQESEDDYPLRVAYAKCLRFAGQDAAAQLLVERQAWQVTRLPEVRWNQMALIPIGLVPFGGIMTIESSVFGMLLEHHAAGFARRLASVLDDFGQRSDSARLATPQDAVVLPNGIVVLNDQISSDTTIVRIDSR